MRCPRSRIAAAMRERVVAGGVLDVIQDLEDEPPARIPPTAVVTELALQGFEDKGVGAGGGLVISIVVRWERRRGNGAGPRRLPNPSGTNTSYSMTQACFVARFGGPMWISNFATLSLRRAALDPAPSSESPHAHF